jgi:hypothetical protein
MAAAPVVPAAEIVALAFLAERPEMDVVLTLCGFDEPIARQRLIQREGFDTLESFGDFSSESIALSLRRLGVLMLLKSRLSLCLIVEEARWELCFFIA